MILKHQYSSLGEHRIVELDMMGFLKESGDWVSYINIATYTIQCVTYIAMTEYFSGTLPLKADTIYQLYETDFISEKCPQKS